MRYREFCQVNEAISYSKHYDDIYRSITSGIFKAFYDLPNHKNEIFNPLNISLSKKYLSVLLKSHLGETVARVVNNILYSGKHKNFLSVNFAPSKSIGSANHMLGYIELSTNHFIEPLAQNLIKNLLILIRISSKTDTADNIIDVIKDISKDSSLQYDLIHGGTDGISSTDLIFDMASTVIHEMVHFNQRDKEFGAGTYGIVRSYLQKRKSDWYQTYDYNDPKFRKLYISSPREMGAFIHNIVLEIINQYPFYNIKKALKGSILVNFIKKFLIKYMGEPKTPKEQMVLNRYIKGVYQELNRYIDYLNSKQQSRLQGPMPDPENRKVQIRSRLGKTPGPKLPY